MELVTNFLLSRDYDHPGTYEDDLGGTVFDYFKDKNRITIIENIENYQILVYNSGIITGYSVKIVENVLSYLKRNYFKE